MGGIRALNPSSIRVTEAADQAMASDTGILIDFTVEKYGSLAACNIASRSFQTTFSGVRNRRRKQRQRAALLPTNDPLSDLRGDYDYLTCTRLPLPGERGWQIQLLKGDMSDLLYDIRDAKTGEALVLDTPMDDVERWGIVALNAPKTLTEYQWSALRERYGDLVDQWRGTPATPASISNDFRTSTDADIPSIEEMG